MLCAAVVATALVVTAAAQSKPSLSKLESPQASEIARASQPIVDAQVVVKAVPDGYWGGEYRTAAGEPVTVYASNSFPVNPTLGQRWADFLGSLIHGPELSTVTVLLSTSTEIERVCGQDAIACYSARGAFLYTPGEDPGSDLSAEAVITHEYGHHIAANRSDAPWNALDYGPKKWSSSMQVCAKARKGLLAPGAEDPVQYTENPGEGWAETYRVLNERKAGRAETPWDIVSDALYPTPPRSSPPSRTWWRRGCRRPRRHRRPRSRGRLESGAFTIAAPLDGTMKVTLRPSAGLRVALDVFASTTRVAHAVSAQAVTRTATICGARSYRIRITALSGRGSAVLTVARP